MNNSLKQKSFFWLLNILFLSLLGSPDESLALNDKRADSFLPEERRIIIEYFSKQKTKGLPPGLAKRGGNLPPGLQKHLQRNGTLPPGLQKRLEPFPKDLETRLPRLPDIWVRVILDRDVLLIDRRTQRVLDIIENVVGLITER